MPASFPNSIFAPATVQNGDTITPTLFNDPNAEIIAIEQGYRQGTAPLNSSGSTVTSLTVTGGSTLGAVTAGASSVASLHVTGASTLDGAVVVNGPMTFGSSGTISLPAVACKVTHSVVQEIPNNTFTGLSWNTELIDSAGMHSTASNSSRVVLTSTGTWAIGVQIAWLGNATPTHETRVHVNDDYVVAQVSDAAFGLDPFVHGATALLEVTNTTTYVTVQVRNTGSTGRVNAYSTAVSIASPSLWAYKV